VAAPCAPATNEAEPRLPTRGRTAAADTPLEKAWGLAVFGCLPRLLPLRPAGRRRARAVAGAQERRRAALGRGSRRQRRRRRQVAVTRAARGAGPPRLARLGTRHAPLRLQSRCGRACKVAQPPPRSGLSTCRQNRRQRPQLGHHLPPWCLCACVPAGCYPLPQFPAHPPPLPLAAGGTSPPPHFFPLLTHTHTEVATESVRVGLPPYP